MRIAGIGFRKGASGAAIVAAVEAALRSHGLALSDLDVLAVHAGKAGEAGVAEAAGLLGLPLVVVPAGAAREIATPTQSPRVIELFGAGSMAEAVALAAAGGGARLIGPRTATPAATCAIAEGGPP